MTIFSVIKVATAVGLLAMRGASALAEIKDSKKTNAPGLISSAVLRAKNLTDRILPVLNSLTGTMPNQIPIGGYNNMYANNYNCGMAQAMPYPNLTAAWTGQQPQPHHDYNYDVLMGRIDPNWGHEEIMRMYANSGYIPPNYPYGYDWQCMFSGQPSIMDSGSRRDCDVLGLSRFANQVPPGYEQYQSHYQQYLNQQQQQRDYWNHVPGSTNNMNYGGYSSTSNCWYNNQPHACWSSDDAWGDRTNLSSYSQNMQQQYQQMNMPYNGMNDSRRNQYQQNPYSQNMQQQTASGLTRAREEELRRQIWGDQYNWRMEQLRQQQQAQMQQVSPQMMPQQQSPYPYPYGDDSQTNNWYPQQQQNQQIPQQSINNWNPYQNMQNPMMNNVDPNEVIRQMQEKQHWKQIESLLEEEDRPKYYQRPANMQMNNYGQQFQQPINDWNQSQYAQQQYQNMGYGYNNYQQPYQQMAQPYDPYEYQRQALADPNRDPYHTNETVNFVNPYYESRKPYEPLPGTVTPENPRGIPDLRNHLYMTGFEDNPSGIDPWADFIKNSRLINDPKYANDFKHCKNMYQFKSSSPQSSLYNGGVDMSQAMPQMNTSKTDSFNTKEDGSANLIRPITGFADPGDPRNLLIGRGGSSNSKNKKKREYTEEEEKAIQDMITNRIIEDSVKDLPPMHLTEEDLARFRWHGEGPDPFDKYRREIMMEKAMKHAENYYAQQEMGVPEATSRILHNMAAKSQPQQATPATSSERTPEPGYEEPDPSMVVPCMYADDGTPIV